MQAELLMQAELIEACTGRECAATSRGPRTERTERKPHTCLSHFFSLGLYPPRCVLSPLLHLPSSLSVSTTVLPRCVPARAELLLQVWDDQCVGRTICLLAFLPGLVDSKAAGRNSYLEIMKNLTTKQTLKKFGFMWTSVGQQAGLEGILYACLGHFPAVLSFRPYL